MAGWAGSARTAGRWLAGDGGRSQNCTPYMGSGRGWLAGGWPSTAPAWTAGFLWWRSGNKKRTQNVSEYMLVLALCLVAICDNCLFDCLFSSSCLIVGNHVMHHLPPLTSVPCYSYAFCYCRLHSSLYRLWIIFLVVLFQYILPECVHSLHTGFVPVRCVQSIVTFISFWLSLALTHCLSVLSNWFSILSCSGLSPKLWVCFGILSFNCPNLTAIQAYWPH